MWLNMEPAPENKGVLVCETVAAVAAVVVEVVGVARERVDEVCMPWLRTVETVVACWWLMPIEVFFRLSEEAAEA